MGEFTTVDVIIPSYKPGKSFRILLERLEAQTHAPNHILIINTEESFWDNALIEGISSAEVFHIKQNQFDHAGTRNMGAGFSRADVIVFMTQDAIPADEYLIESLLDGFREPSIKAVYARQLPAEDAGMIEQFTRGFNYPNRSMKKKEEDLKRMGIKAFFCSNVCAAYDHAYFKAMDGFRVPAIFNEDMVFAGSALRAGQA
ncbi:MAG: glycosyltransferase, partial [Lachnospiraceae bacterium]|nr:glycosyltransferase [Candidatus Equihabitans merdae]